MSTLTFHPARLSGVAQVPPAKSEAHRAVLLAALGSRSCRLSGFSGPLCNDTLAMLSGAAALGAHWAHEDGALVITPGAGQKTDVCRVHACAAALRMLLPVFLAKNQPVRMMMDAALYARPRDAFDTLAARLDARVRVTPPGEDGMAALELCGHMPAGAYEVDGTRSSQFASGMLIALAHATDAAGHPAGGRLTVRGPIASRPYLDMTLRAMERFDAPVREIGEGVFDIHPAGDDRPEAWAVPGDWSQAAVLLCLNALGANVRVRGLASGSQGDERVMDVLSAMGMRVGHQNGEWYAACASRARLRPVSLDCTDIPDIAPILALALTQARGESVLTGVHRLRIKECDRLSATVELLSQLGADARAEEDRLIVQGPARLRGGFTADARADHRMVMLLAAAASAADGPITVAGAECIAKSWPGFAETYAQLGGAVT